MIDNLQCGWAGAALVTGIRVARLYVDGSTAERPVTQIRSIRQAIPVLKDIVLKKNG